MSDHKSFEDAMKTEVTFTLTAQDWMMLTSVAGTAATLNLQPGNKEALETMKTMKEQKDMYAHLNIGALSVAQLIGDKVSESMAIMMGKKEHNQETDKDKN